MGWYAKRYDPLQAGSIDGKSVDPHDHAIKRAMTAKYRKPNDRDGVSTDPEKTLFIGNLTASTTSDDLKVALSRYGEIEKAIVIRNKITGISRRYGFVTFTDQQSALDLFRASRKHTISVEFKRQSATIANSHNTITPGLVEVQKTNAIDNTSLDTDFDEAPEIAGLDPTLDSSTVLVDFERSRVMEGWVPRRLGGGIGGKKESGQLRFGGGIKPFRFPIE
ncbi:small nuclear ribonucleoprotein 35kDa (U11 U12) [Mortierella sp. AM989]|nr:small nuclear ribonucleoprotein 35kDa (U11 U12) [Mortierella sp. AM989]